VIAWPNAQVEQLRGSLSDLLEEPGRQDGRSRRQPTESLGEAPYDERFIEGCRLALNRLVGLKQEGVILMCSPRRKEGRSSAAAGVAKVLSTARGRARVLILDLDFRWSRQAAIFSVAPDPGLADFLEGRDRRLRAVAGGTDRQLWLVPAGQHFGDPARLIHEIGGQALISTFREFFDWVVIDVPPLLTNPEVAALAPFADWHLVVGRHRRTLVAELSKVRELIGDGEAGFLLTGDSTRIPRWIRRLL
jgi:Mrp family chromosome partitioning ATPase